ncbi:hypothetical protein [Rhizobium sp. N122]|uniref:hypothetical protein n=1 Tax=Rhizobium sp. N122 TaxID=1764272 RepID=UPI00167E7E2D|nr:hypothetical protein [Rhizobium sp. N122]
MRVSAACAIEAAPHWWRQAELTGRLVRFERRCRLLQVGARNRAGEAVLRQTFHDI